jgi:hypothetical protein
MVCIRMKQYHSDVMRLYSIFNKMKRVSIIVQYSFVQLVVGIAENVCVEWT